MSTVEYDLEGDSSSLVSSLEQAIREFTATTKAANETKQATQKLTEEQRRAADEAKKSGDAYNGLVKILKQFGGTIGGTTDTLDDMGEGLEKLLPSLGSGTIAAGAMTAGLAALTATAAATIASLIGVARAAVAAGKSMGDSRVDDLASSVNALDQAWEDLEVALATGNGAAREAVDIFAGMIVAGTEVVQILNAMAYATDAFGTTFRVTSAIVTLGMSEAVRAVAGFFAELGNHGDEVQSLDEVKKGIDAITKAIDEAGEHGRVYFDSGEHGMDLLIDQETKRKEAIKASAAEETKAAAAREAELVKQIREGQALSAWLKAEVKKEEADAEHLRDVTLDAIADKARAAAEYAKQVVTLQEKETKEFEDALKERQKLIEDAALGAAAATVNIFGQVADAMADEWNEQLAELDAAISASEGKVSELQQAVDEADRNRLAAIRAGSAGSAALAKQQEDEAKAALKAEKIRLADIQATKRQIAHDAFIAEKEATIGDAIMQGGLAVVTAFAQLGPVGGAVAASFIGAMLATQIGIIQSQKPPPAHDGGRLGADEFVVGNRTVRNGEAAVVFNQRAVQNGALEQAARINRDQGGDGSREVRLVLGDAGRVIGELVARETRRPGSRLAGAFGSTGVVDPYNRSR